MLMAFPEFEISFIIKPPEPPSRDGAPLREKGWAC